MTRTTEESKGIAPGKKLIMLTLFSWSGEIEVPESWNPVKSSQLEILRNLLEAVCGKIDHFPLIHRVTDFDECYKMVRVLTRLKRNHKVKVAVKLPQDGETKYAEDGWTLYLYSDKTRGAAQTLPNGVVDLYHEELNQVRTVGFNEIVISTEKGYKFIPVDVE